MDRLLKLIPGETTAVYLSLQGFITSALDGEAGQLQTWLWIIVGVLALGNILYLRQSQAVSDPVQLTILTVAFLIWVMTIGGPFAMIPGYQPFMGSVILGLFTFFAPLVYKGKDVNA